MIVVGGLKLGNGTAPGGTPTLRVAPEHPYSTPEVPSRELDRQEVEELRDVCEAWLRGEVLR